MSNFFELSATQIVDLLKRGETNPLEVLDHFTKRALDFGKDLGAVLYFNLEQARNLAQQLSENNSFKELPLAGLPISIKDNIAVSDNPLSCASNFLRSYRSSFNAEVISGILADGGIPFNKLNMDEFAMGSSNENSAFSVVKNPWNQEKVPGGSSGGSAAAVAAGITPLALGSDTGGSIRQPASFCGVCGYKPSYGMLSRFGLVAFASSLDQIGPLSRSIEDLALLMPSLVKNNQLDATLDENLSKDFNLSKTDLKGLKFGVVLEQIKHPGLDEDVRLAFEETLEALTSEGAEIIEISMESLKYALATYYITATAEASSNLSRFDGVRYGHRVDQGEGLLDLYKSSRNEGFGKEVKRRILLGTFVLSSGYYDAFYGKAQYARNLIRKDYQNAFGLCDLILSPTTPSAAFSHNSKTDDPISMYLADIFTVPVNLAGLPALSLPMGLSEQNLPLGLHITGPYGFDKKLLEIALAVQNAIGGPLPVADSFKDGL